MFQDTCNECTTPITSGENERYGGRCEPCFTADATHLRSEGFSFDKPQDQADLEAFAEAVSFGNGNVSSAEIQRLGDTMKRKSEMIEEFEANSGEFDR